MSSLNVAKAVETLDDDQKVALLITVFNQLFSQSQNTVLAHAQDEPIYVPANAALEHHTIFFAHGYFSSALHEMSHWLVAGEQRRLLEDFGYWYKPDGRSASEQQEFEQVEVKPQAIEWFLSKCCGHTFHFSADNLSGGATASDSFKSNVRKQARAFLQPGVMNDRMEQLVTVLTANFNQEMPTDEDFLLP